MNSREQRRSHPLKLVSTLGACRTVPYGASIRFWHQTVETHSTLAPIGCTFS
jgi:hypothetical protein